MSLREWGMKRTITALLLGVAFVLFTGASAQAADCEYRLGFKTLRDLIGHHIVGECLENEHYNAIGDSNQQSTGGLMAWRKADNWTAFTDGYRSWINGPNGLVQRLNTERFSWEADYAPGGGIASPAPAPVLPSPVPAVSADCPTEADVVARWHIFVGSLSEQRIFGYWADVAKNNVYPRYLTVEWACFKLRQLGHLITG